MSESRLMQILASLARRSPLRTLHTICETQHQISTRKLEQYLEPIGDELAGFAFNLRQDYDALRKERDTLRTANQRLEGALRTLHGLMHHKATTPLELEAIRMSEAALAGTGEEQ